MQVLKSIHRQTKDFWAPALYHSVTHGNTTCLQALLRFDADPNSGSHEGRPLQIAVRNDDIRATELLLCAGPDVRTPNAISSLVDTAISQANVHISRLLMENITDVNTPVDPPQSELPPETETWKLWVS